MPSENGQSAKDAYLADLDAQIERLVALRALVECGGDASAVGSPSLAPLGRRRATETQVHPGSFLGMSVPQATRRFLEIMGKSKPQTPQAIAAALVQGNQDKPENEPTVLRNVYTAFKRGKNKEGGFKKVGKFWGLAEWYPSSALATDTSSVKKKRKSKRKGRSAKAAQKPKKPAKVARVAKVASPAPKKGGWHSYLAERLAAGKTMKEAGAEWRAKKGGG